MEKSTMTRKQYEYIRAREQDIDMAFEHSDLSYLNKYPADETKNEDAIPSYEEVKARMES